MAESFERIAPMLRSRLVAEQIIAWIQTNAVAVGQKLVPERELATSMGVSRNTLREAIAILQLGGILEVKQGSGVFVASIPEGREAGDWLEDIGLHRQIDPVTAIDARIALEPGVAILASQVATQHDWRKIDAYLEAMRRARAAGDFNTYRRNDNRLHRAIALATHNRVVTAALLPLLDTAQQPLWYTIKNNVYSVGLIAQSLQEHEDIVAAMLCRDSIRIFTHMTNHLQRSKDRLTLDVEESE